MKKIICIVLILPLLWQCTERESKKADEYVSLELKLKGKKYDKLSAITNRTIYNEAIAREHFTIEGNSEDGYNWFFLIPDSLINSSTFFQIVPEPFDFEKNEAYELAFSTKEVHHRMLKRGISLDEKENVIEGTFIKLDTIIFTYQWEYHMPDTIVISPTVIEEVFYVEIKEKDRYPEWELDFVYPYYGLMPEEGYKEAMKECIALAKKYPDSQSLIDRIGPGMGFRSRKDIKRVYNSFSKKARKKHREESPHIAEYLSALTMRIDIDTLKLTNIITGKLEAVIAGKSKPTLVVFSCIGWESHDKRVPFLKEIYKDNSALDLVLINTDETTMNEWERRIREEQPLWRNYSAKRKEVVWPLSDTYLYWGDMNSVLLIENRKLRTLFIRNNDELQEIINKY